MSRFIPSILPFLNDQHSYSRNRVNRGSVNGGFTMFISAGIDSNHFDMYTQGQLGVASSLPMATLGHISFFNNFPMYLNQGHSDKILPSGTSSYNPTGYWLNSSGTDTNMWSYVNSDPNDSQPDTTYIASYQSGQAVAPQNMYWVSDAGIMRMNLANSGVTKIFDGNSNTQLSTHIAYNPIDDFIYYGVEDGNNARIYRVDSSGNRSYTINSSLGAGISFSSQDNRVYSLNKDGGFKILIEETGTGSLTSLLGKETLNRRTRYDENNGYVYAIKSETTGYIAKLYRYNVNTSTWEYLRVLSKGMYGGAFDIDFNGQQIYYTATTDYFLPNYYGVVKESITSGTAVTIASGDGLSYFQTRDLIYNNYTGNLFYSAEDISGANTIYTLIKTDASGNNRSTVLTMPEISGFKAMTLDGGLYRSSIDFQLTDFTSDFGINSDSSQQVTRAFVTLKGQNTNQYSYVRAQILTGDKQATIWEPTYSTGGKIPQGSGEILLDIGFSQSSVNIGYNTKRDWDNAILRLSVAASPSGNNDVTRIYSTNVTAYSVDGSWTSLNSGLPLNVTGAVQETGSFPMVTLGDTAWALMPMYTSASVGISGDFSQYTYGHIPVNSGVPLYIYGQIPSGNFPMYSLGHTSINSGLSLFTQGIYLADASLPLFLKVQDVTTMTSGIPLYMFSTSGSGLSKTLTLYIENSISGLWNGNMPLYVGGEGGISRSASMPLYLRSDTPYTNKTFPLFLGNYYSSSGSGIPLYIEAPSGTLGAISIGASVPLYIARSSEWTWNNIPMYLKVNSGEYSSFPLYINGGTWLNSSFTMSMSGLGNSYGNISLMVRGY